MYSKILLTLDGSELGKAAIPHAAQLASGSDTEVIALSVTDTLEQLRLRMITEAYEVDPNHDPNEAAKSTHFIQQRDAKQQLADAEKQLRDAGVQSVRTVVHEGLPGNVIVDTALAEGAGAVVMATRGHSGLGREVVGSVAEYVLRHAGPLAVVLVGPRGAMPAGSG
jgi:nucleotide-binding universal stress UspA family protein